jgi:hypothetical protein
MVAHYYYWQVLNSIMSTFPPSNDTVVATARTVPWHACKSFDAQSIDIDGT